MSKKLSEEQALKKIARYEKKEAIIKFTGTYGLVIGVPVTLLSAILKASGLALIFGVIFAIGIFLHLSERPYAEQSGITGR